MAIRFGPFRLDLAERRLTREGEVLDVQDQVIEVLAALCERPGGLWTRDELHARLWPDAIVSEDALFQAVAKTRKALSDPARKPIYIVTVPGHGYRFLAEVEAARDTTAAPGPAPELPRPTTSFVGREDLRDRLLSEVEATPGLWTLTGPGGMGKTRLCLEVAGRYPGAVLFCDLQGATDLGGVWGAVGRALHVVAHAPDQPDLVAETLADRGDLLLILDNGEQVASDLARAAARLSSAAPQARLLVTSRIRLGLAHEHLLELAPLDLPPAEADLDVLAASPAGALLLQRARDSAGWAPRPEHAAALAALVRALGGLPLAIELAAPRLRLLAPDQLLARMDRQLDLLGGRAPDRPSRHATLRSAIAASWELLSPELQRALSWLSVFAGPFSFAVAEDALAEACADPFLALAELVDHSLVRRRDDRPERPLLELLPSIRVFARSHLDEADGRAALGRVAEAYARAAAHPGPEDLAAWQAGQERDSLVLVLEHAVGNAWPAVAAAVAETLSRSLLAHGPLHEVGSRLAPVLALPELAPEDCSRLLLVQAEARLVSTEVDAAAPLLDQAEALAVPGHAGRLARLRAAWHYRSGDIPGTEAAVARGLALPELPAAERARMLFMRGHCEALSLRGADALSSLEQARVLVEALDLRALRAELLYELGCVNLSFRGLAEGLALLEESLASARAEGNPTAVARAQAMAGRALAHMRRRDEARRALAAAEPVLRRAGLTQELGTLLDCRGQLAAGEGRLDEAEALLREAIGLLEGAGQALTAPDPHNSLATVLIRQGRLEEAEVELLQVLAVVEQQGRNPATILHNLGEIDLRLGRLDRARERIQASQRAHAAGGKAVSEALAWITLGEIDLAQRRPAEAAGSLSHAESLLRSQARRDHLVLCLAYLGLALGLDGQHDRAAAAFADALELADEAPPVQLRGMVLARQAQVAWHRGEGARARELLERARRADGERCPPEVEATIAEVAAEVGGQPRGGAV